MGFFGIPGRLLFAHSPKLNMIIALTLVGASLAWQSTTWLFFLQNPARVALPKPSAPPTRPAPSLEQLLPLFATPAATTKSVVQQTNLRLNLLGSFVQSETKKSTALIQSEGRAPEAYALNAHISEGVILHAVYADRVELERNGRLESLHFTPYSTSEATGHGHPSNAGAMRR